MKQVLKKHDGLFGRDYEMKQWFKDAWEYSPHNLLGLMVCLVALFFYIYVFIKVIS